MVSIQACLALLCLIMLVNVTGLCVGWRGSTCYWFGYLLLLVTDDAGFMHLPYFGLGLVDKQ